MRIKEIYRVVKSLTIRSIVSRPHLTRFAGGHSPGDEGVRSAIAAGVLVGISELEV